MSGRVLAYQLISQSKIHMREMSVHLRRVDSQFLVERSLTHAIEELDKTKKLLEQAKINYTGPSSSMILNSSSSAEVSMGPSK